VYSLLHGTERLLVDHDRVGVLRPTRHIPCAQQTEVAAASAGADVPAAAAAGDVVLVDKPEWKTVDRWLHVGTRLMSFITRLVGQKPHPNFALSLYSNFIKFGF
jgi:hypothetical protein